MTTQRERLRAYLQERGAITAVEAWQLLGIWRAAARINELRNEGFLIETERCEGVNRYGEPYQVARYRLQEPQRELFGRA